MIKIYLRKMFIYFLFNQYISRRINKERMMKIMKKKITTLEQAKKYLNKKEVASFEMLKEFYSETLLKTAEKELIKKAQYVCDQEFIKKEKSIALITLYQKLFKIDDINEVANHMKKLASENLSEEILEDEIDEDEKDFVDLDEDFEETNEENFEQNQW